MSEQKLFAVHHGTHWAVHVGSPDGAKLAQFSDVDKEWTGERGANALVAAVSGGSSEAVIALEESVKRLQGDLAASEADRRAAVEARDSVQGTLQVTTGFIENLREALEAVRSAKTIKEAHIAAKKVLEQQDDAPSAGSA